MARGERLHRALGESGRAGVADRASAVPALRRGSSCTEGSRDGEDIQSLPLQVPAPGEYTLRVWLEDAAGNHDAERASDPVSLRFDDEAPTAVFEASRRGRSARR